MYYSSSCKFSCLLMLALLLASISSGLAQLKIKNSSNQDLMQVAQSGQTSIGSTVSNAKLFVNGNGGTYSEKTWGTSYINSRTGIRVYNTDDFQYNFGINSYVAGPGLTGSQERIAVNGCILDNTANTLLASGSLGYSQYYNSRRNVWGVRGVLKGDDAQPFVSGSGGYAAALGAHVYNDPTPFTHVFSVYADGAKSYFSSNVGIGTTSPQAFLHIDGGASPAAGWISSTYGGSCSAQFGVGEMKARYNSTEDLYFISDVDNTNSDASAIGIVFACNNGQVGGTNYKWLMNLKENGSLLMANGAQCTAAGVWTNASSHALKENINPLSERDAVQALLGLSPVTFTYKAEPLDPCVGFIAEEVPELVASKDRNGLSAMDVVAVLTKVVQAQQQDIQSLKEEVARLRK